MDTNKHIQIEVFESRNIYADVFIPIMRRPGYKSGVNSTYSVISSKQIGLKSSSKDELDKIILMIKKLKSHNVAYIVSSGKLDFKPANATIQIIKNSFKNYEVNNDLIKTSIEDVFNNKDIISYTRDKKQDTMIKDALINTLIAFENSETTINSSKVINLAVKLIHWINHYLVEVMKNQSLTLDKTSINSKIIHFGDMSSQDAYYALLAYYLGYDFLYITFENTDISHFPKKLLELGKLLKHSNFDNNSSLLTLVTSSKKESTTSKVNSAKASPSPVRSASVARQNIKATSPSPSMSNINFDRPGKKTSSTPTRIDADIKASLVKKDIKSNIIINHKKFDGDLKSILAPLKDRAGFAGQPSPILPVYFTRYIGSDSDKNVYRNRLFKINKTLALEYRNYIKFESPIKLGSYSDINKKTSPIWQEYSQLSLDNIDDLTKYLMGSDVFSFIKDEELENRASLAIGDLLRIAFHGASSIPTSKVKNLVVKLIGWLSDHSKDIINGYSYDKTHNPKILFYGDIKTHEALYLIFLHYIGIDIIYVNSFQDDVFEALDPDMNFSSVHTLDKVCTHEEFPTSEVMVLQQTTAYEASEEISKIVHNDQDGVYKPWQFESYKTMPLTLRTTYDEAFILWNEHARIRTGFKVEKNTIYIPNMFIKISATHDDINEYWSMVGKATSPKLTQLYSKLPFTNIDFSNREFYSVDTAFENHKKLSLEKLKKHQLYKYSHLSNDLQNLIFDKLSMLLDSDILTNNEEELRLKIVYTVLNLNPELLKLIQNFDFPAHIPKLVIYDSDENTFSESDAITLAFLYSLAFDICVLTPTGYNNFEMFIDEKYYSVFKLPNKQFNLELVDLKRHSAAKGKGFWASIFG